MNEDDHMNPISINKFTAPELEDELRIRGLSIAGNRPELKAQFVQYLDNEKTLDNNAMNKPNITVINVVTTNATIVNSVATIVRHCTTDAIFASGGITSTPVINDNATISS